MIVPTLNGIPVINQMGAYRPTEPTEHGAKFAFYSGGQIARAEWGEVAATMNASAPTMFLFEQPIFVHTDKEYAIIVKFDGNENYVLWNCNIGDWLVGTETVATGPSSKFSGTLYQFIDDPNKSAPISDTGYAYSDSTIDADQANNAALLYTASVRTFEQLDTNYLQANWSPLPNKDLKCSIHVAKYSVGGVPIVNLPEWYANVLITNSDDRPAMYPPRTAVSNGIVHCTAPVQTTEYVVYDLKTSTKDDLVFGEPFYQDGPFHPGGTSTPLTVTCYPPDTGANTDYASRLIQANASYVLPGGSTFDSGGGFTNIVEEYSYIVIKDADNNIYLKTVSEIVSNTEILVSSPFESTLSNTTFRIAPLGYLYDISKTSAFGKSKDLVTFYNSTSNSTIKFESFAISNVSIVAAGESYSNSDYIKIMGYEDIGSPTFAVQGNYPAYANIVTNASGNITAVYISNSGAGFVNSSWIAGSNVVIYKSEANGQMTTNPTDGSGANLTINVGSSIKSAFKGTIFANCNIINLQAMRMKPEITVNNPLGSSFTIRHRTLYHCIDDPTVSGGKAYYADTPAESAATDTYAKIFKSHTLGNPGLNKTPVLTSRSNEYKICFANGALPDANTTGNFFSNTCVFIFDISSNSDYQAAYFDPEIVTSHYAKYIINNDYTNEHTNYGSAWAKHVMTKINMTIDRFAEDCLVYLTAYRPANTDLKVYARLHNSKDEQAFDDTDWTLLEQIDGIGMYSSKSNDTDYKELTYNLPAYPNTDFTMNGSVTLYQGNAYVTGTDTIFGPRIVINSGGTGYANGDTIYFTATSDIYDNGDGNFAYRASVNASANVGTNSTGGITSLTITDAGVGWDDQSVIDTFTAFHANGAVSGGSTANLYFYPGLQADDLIKIYSPYSDWANTNYTIAVVNSVVSNTLLTVKRTFGELSANLVGNVSITAACTVVTGTDTLFEFDFSVGDFIAVWANSSTYETRKIASIASNTSLTMEAASTYSNTATYYAYVTPDTFMNTSTNVTELLVDRLAYKHQAFNNIQNDNVARYYNKSMVEFDSYDTLQIKVVFLSPSDTNVPKFDDVRGVLVTA